MSSPAPHDLNPTLALVAALAASALDGCAGPATPLGAPWVTKPSDAFEEPISLISSYLVTKDSSIRFVPARQKLHGPSPLTIIIDDPSGIRSNYRLIVRHNGLDVTHSFLHQAQLTIDGNQLRVHVPLLRLPPNRDHRIEIIYNGGGNSVEHAYARYEPPVCHAFSPNSVRTTESFAPPAKLLDEIRRLSTAHSFNPAFVTGLIAQESGFETRTVSWAKAIGLTQITPLAEDEIIAEYDDWPRYPGINELPAPLVKVLVAAGYANSGNEWRLDTTRSINGGLTYLEMLAQHWTEPPSLQRIRATFPDPDVALTRLVLASYNSGYTRVAQAFSRDGVNWLAAPELREARSYVGRIVSYCDHFSEKGDPL